jgi:hypothetical protein
LACLQYRSRRGIAIPVARPSIGRIPDEIDRQRIDEQIGQRLDVSAELHAPHRIAGIGEKACDLPGDQIGPN